MSLAITFVLVLVAVQAATPPLNTPVVLKEYTGYYFMQHSYDKFVVRTRSQQYNTVWYIVPYDGYYLIKSHVGMYLKGSPDSKWLGLSSDSGPMCQWTFVKHGSKWSMKNRHFKTFVTGREIRSYGSDGAWMRFTISAANSIYVSRLTRRIDVPISIKEKGGKYFQQSSSDKSVLQLSSSLSGESTTWWLIRYLGYFRVKTKKGCLLQGGKAGSKPTLSGSISKTSLFRVYNVNFGYAIKNKRYFTYLTTTGSSLYWSASRHTYESRFTLDVRGKKDDEEKTC